MGLWYVFKRRVGDRVWFGGGGRRHFKGRLRHGNCEKRKKKRNPCDLELTYNPQKRK